MSSTGTIGQEDPSQLPFTAAPVYIDPFLAPRPPHVPFGCTVCKGIDNEDKILVCDNNCGRESHIYCLRPPLQEIPEGEWLCEVCDPQGSTKYLEEYLNKVEQQRLKLCPDWQSPNDYEIYIQNNAVPLEEMYRLFESRSYSHEFDVQDEQLIGQKVRVFCEIDQRYHMGRILGRRKNELFCQIEHIVLFKSFHDSRNTPLMRWIDLQELSCQVSGAVLWVNRGGNTGSGYVFWPGQRFHRSLKNIFQEERGRETKDTTQLLYVFGEEEWVRGRSRGGLEVADWASRGFTKSTSSKAHLFAYLAAWMELEEHYHIHNLHRHFAPSTISTYLLALEGGGMGDGIHVMQPIFTYTDLTLPVIEKIAGVYRGYKDGVGSRVRDWLKGLGASLDDAQGGGDEVFTDKREDKQGGDEASSDGARTKKRAKRGRGGGVEVTSGDTIGNDDYGGGEMKREGQDGFLTSASPSSSLVLDSMYINHFYKMPMDFEESEERGAKTGEIASIVPVGEVGVGGWKVEAFTFHSHLESVLQERERREKELRLQAEQERTRRRVELIMQTKQANKIRKLQQREERARERREREEMESEDALGMDNQSADGCGDVSELGSGCEGGEEGGRAGSSAVEPEIDWSYWLAQDKKEYTTRLRTRKDEGKGGAKDKPSKKAGKKKMEEGLIQRRESPRLSSNQAEYVVSSSGIPHPPLPAINESSMDIETAGHGNGDMITDNQENDVRKSAEGLACVGMKEDQGHVDSAKGNDDDCLDANVGDYLNSSPSFADDFSFSDDDMSPRTFNSTTSSHPDSGLHDPLEPVYVTHSAPISHTRRKTQTLKPSRTKFIDPPPSAAPLPASAPRKVHADTMSYVLSKLKQKVVGGDGSVRVGNTGTSRTTGDMKATEIVENSAVASKIVRKDGKKIQDAREDLKVAQKADSKEMSRIRSDSNVGDKIREDRRDSRDHGKYGLEQDRGRVLSVGNSVLPYDSHRKQPNVDNGGGRSTALASGSIVPPSRNTPSSVASTGLAKTSKSVGFASSGSDVASGYVARHLRGLPSRWDELPSRDEVGISRECELKHAASAAREHEGRFIGRDYSKEKRLDSKSNQVRSDYNPVRARSSVENSRQQVEKSHDSVRARPLPLALANRDPRLVARASMYAAFAGGADAQFSSESEDEKQNRAKASTTATMLPRSFIGDTDPTQTHTAVIPSAADPWAVQGGAPAPLVQQQSQLGFVSGIGHGIDTFYGGQDHPVLPPEEAVYSALHGQSQPRLFSNNIPAIVREDLVYGNYPPENDFHQPLYEHENVYRPDIAEMPSIARFPERFINRDPYPMGYEAEAQFSRQVENRHQFRGQQVDSRSHWYRQEGPPPTSYYNQQDVEQDVYRDEVHYHPEDRYVDERWYADQQQESGPNDNSFVNHHVVPRNGPYLPRPFDGNDQQRPPFIQPRRQYRDSYQQWNPDTPHGGRSFLPDQQDVVAFEVAVPQAPAFARIRQQHPYVGRIQSAHDMDMMHDSHVWHDAHHTFDVPPNEAMQTNFPKLHEYEMAEFPDNSRQFNTGAPMNAISPNMDNRTTDDDLRHLSKQQRRRLRRQQMKIAQEQAGEEDADKGIQLVGSVAYGMDFRRSEFEGDIPPILSVPFGSSSSENRQVSSGSHSQAVTGQKRAASLVSRKVEYDARYEATNGNNDDDSSIDSVQQPGDSDYTEDVAVESIYGQLGYSEGAIHSMKLARKNANIQKNSRINNRPAKKGKHVGEAAPLAPMLSIPTMPPAAPALSLPPPPGNPRSALSQLLMKYSDGSSSTHKSIDILRQFTRSGVQPSHADTVGARTDRKLSQKASQVAEEGEVE